MNQELQLLRGQRLPKLSDVQFSRTSNFRTWLSSMKYVPLYDISDKQIVLQYQDDLYLAECIAGDFTRLGLAAFETASSISENNYLTKSMAWTVIKSYYVCFFATHALLRAHKSGFIKIENSQIEMINDLVKHHQIQNDNSLKKGYYRLSVDSKLKTISLNFIGGNSHEDLWKVFLTFLSELGDKINSGSGLTSDKQDIEALILEIRGAVKKRIPSTIRNNLNYSQEYGIWYPFGAYKQDGLDEVPSFLDDWKCNPLSISVKCRQSSDVKRLVALSQLLLALLRYTVDDLEHLATNRNHFTKRSLSSILSIMRD